MRGYVVVFEGDGEAGYSAYSPDLPGVVAAGSTHRETERLMIEAMAEHIALLQQAVDWVGHCIQGRAHDRQVTERLPLLLGLEEYLEDHAPAAGVPGPVEGAVGQRGLDQGGVMLLLPPESRELAVQHLDRPPLGHSQDSTRFRRICPVTIARCSALSGGR